MGIANYLQESGSSFGVSPRGCQARGAIGQVLVFLLLKFCKNFVGIRRGQCGLFDVEQAVDGGAGESGPGREEIEKRQSLIHFLWVARVGDAVEGFAGELDFGG